MQKKLYLCYLKEDLKTQFGILKQEKCSYLFESHLNYSRSDVCVDVLAPFCLEYLTPGIIPVVTRYAILLDNNVKIAMVHILRRCT